MKNILEKYLQRSDDILKSGKIIEEKINCMPFLINSSDKNFILQCTLVKEVKKYAKNKGYILEKIIFFSAYDADILEDDINYSRIKSNSDSYLSIIEYNNRYIGVIFFGSTIESFC